MPLTLQGRPRQSHQIEPLAKEREAKRIILANPDEPRAGDYSYGLYDKAHPVFGEAETIAYMKKQLRGLKGERITVEFKGVRIDDDGESKRFTVKRTGTYRQYSSMFGPGSLYASAMHAVRERHSDETLVTHSIVITAASGDDDDGE